ncbi:amidase signature enzyme [Dothidotthia symphoricarpi CBS 119687]|uniref:Amidase signature enzyme n=1 Tax=Dothidotthia symphoricarpi CBS 119687 TaxID=1392245 RepID=A0A6A6A0D1_9PLEO|nr:amidase signature enzyme [Dothidotthia symphoricarpi CBS 119687]KAF2124976.1 amidase signature enzyme [Dothidotthia symphoricarpi CBS 119687]
MSFLLRFNVLSCHKAFPAMERRYSHHLTLSPKSFSIEDRNYIARPTEHVLSGNVLKSNSFATVLAVRPGDTVNAGTLRKQFAHFTKIDDVFHPRFLEGIIFQGAEQSQVTIDVTPSEILKEWGIEWAEFQPTLTVLDPSVLPPGPYLIQNGQLSQVWRVYSDDNLAFLQSVWPSIKSPSEFAQVPFAGTGHRTLGIAVPSRLQSSVTERCPLAGVRVGIKDLYHLKGIRTSLCNRAFNDLYPPQLMTSPTILHLISKGVHVVGKNHLSSFALQEHPTQSVDYESPFNPRADGYQIPGGSSSGSASAVASYEWLDFAIATDATGSVRIPALQNGCFGLRPSTNTLSTEGVVSVYPGFDTPSLLGRDLSRFHNFASVWYGEKHMPKSIRSPKLLVPTDFLVNINANQLQLVESFLRDLERGLDTIVERCSIAEAWTASAPVDERNLNIYLQNATLHSYYYEAFHAFNEFQQSYKGTFGRKPFITETNRWIWSWGANVTQAQHDDMDERLRIFKDWFLEKYMKVNEQDSVLIFPISDVRPNYRDTYPGLSKEPSTGLRSTYLSPYLGAPELGIPIGHINYESRISGNIEYLPVAISLMGPPGSDLALIELTMNVLQASNRPTSVRPGTARMWEYDVPTVSTHL